MPCGPRQVLAWSSIQTPAAARSLKAGHADAALMRRRTRAAASPSPSDSEFEGVGGDAGVQDALEQQLRFRVASEEIKESIREDLRSKIEDVKQISETVRCRRAAASAPCHVRDCYQHTL